MRKDRAPSIALGAVTFRSTVLTTVSLSVLAAGILSLAASAAWAETTISKDIETPVSTSTAASGAADDLTISSKGSITLTGGTAVTLDSDNSVDNEGSITVSDADGAVGVLIEGGRTGELVNSGSIVLNEDYDAEDTDGDGDLDGPFAEGSGRFGVLVNGTAAFNGSIVNDGTISVEGNDSAGIWVGPTLNGALTTTGSVSVIGDRSVGIRLADVTGDVTLRGAVSAVGESSVGLQLDGNISGTLAISNAITARGYRYTSRPEVEIDDDVKHDDDNVELEELDADDLLQGGSAVAIRGDVAGGVILETPPLDEDDENDDEDGDGVDDEDEGTGSITAYGSAPALDIGAAGRSITLGAVGQGDLAYGLVNNGGISGAGVFGGVSATALQIGTGGGGVTLEGGLSNAGSISATAYEADAYSIRILSGAEVPALVNSGSIVSSIVGDQSGTSYGVVIEAGAQVASVSNSGSLIALVSGEAGDATAFVDRSGNVALFENTGGISAQISATDDDYDTDDANTDPSDETVTGKAVALDFSANTTGVTVRQYGVNDGDDGDDGVDDADDDGDGVDDADEPTLVGAVLMGRGDDRLELLNGVAVSDVAFGLGADSLLIDGGALLKGALSDADGRLDIAVTDGELDLTNLGLLSISSLQVGSAGTLTFTADPAADEHGELAVSGAASFADGAKIDVRLLSGFRDTRSYTLLTAGSLTSGALDESLLGDAPYLYAASIQADATAGELTLTLRPKSAGELGLNRSETAALDAVLDSVIGSDDLEAVFLARTTRSSFLTQYAQMLPDHAGGVFESMSAATRRAALAPERTPVMRGEWGEEGVWLQQITGRIDKSRTDAAAYQIVSVGFVAGRERSFPSGWARGVSIAYSNNDVEDASDLTDTRVVADHLEAGVYLRSPDSYPFHLFLRAGLGYAHLNSDRHFLGEEEDGTSTHIIAESDWHAATASMVAKVSYEAALGPVFVRPEATLDGFWLYEGAHDERGGSTSYDLMVDDRVGSRLSATAALTAGARLRRGASTWTFESLAGWREPLAGRLGATTARFASGSPFSLDAEDDQGRAVVGFAFSFANELSAVGLNGEGEFGDGYTEFAIRLSAKFLF